MIFETGPVTYMNERTIDDPRVCSPATLSPPYMTVALKLTTPSTRHVHRPNSMLHCGSGGSKCSVNDITFKNQNTVIDWRDREEPGSNSKLKDETYRLLQQRTESAWNASVIWHHPTQTEEKEKKPSSAPSPFVPWIQSARKKRIVIDNILTKEECQLLIRVAEKHTYSGSSYSGSHRNATAMNKVSSASWVSLLQDQSTDMRKQAAKVSIDAISRIRAVVMTYFNLTSVSLKTYI